MLPPLIPCKQTVPKTTSNAEFHGSIRWINSEPSRLHSIISLVHAPGKARKQNFLSCASMQELSQKSCQGKQKLNFLIFLNTPVNYYQVEMHVIKVGGLQELNYDKTPAC